MRGRFRATAPLALLAAGLALALGALGGCTLRDRANPLDPRNEKTQGRLTGFNARAGDGVVELAWTPLTQEGVLSYEVQRWAPGGAPARLPGAVYAPHVSAAEDLDVRNDSTYLYRLVAHLASGDSAVSPADTVTPGTRRTMVLVADAPGVAGLSPDGRDIAYVRVAADSWYDLDLDARRGVFWMSQVERGVIVGRTFEGTGAFLEIDVPRPADLTVSFQRGSLWAARPEAERVERFGTADTNVGLPGTPILGVGPARVVEADNRNGTVWVGAEDGGLFRASAATSAVLESWRLGARVTAIAVDETSGDAWVATRSGSLGDLYRVTPGDSTPVVVRAGLLNVTDLEVEPSGRTLWVCERGAPLAGNGRLSRLGAAGNALATVTGLEPYAVAVEAGSAGCWVTDIRSDRLLQITAEGLVSRRSPPLGVPYGVRVYRP